METHKVIAECIFKYKDSNLNELESQVLQEWIDRSERNRKLFNRLSDNAYWEKVREIDLEEVWQKVVTPAKPVHKLKPKRVFRIKPAVAACIVLLVIAGYFLLHNKEGKMAPAMNGNNPTHPYLQLADGSTLELNDAVTGPVASNNGQEVRNRNRQIRFDPVSDSKLLENNKIFYAGPFFESVNTIVTPKGSTYMIILPDGTEVTLNECSMLKFPSQFDPNERVVELSGNEAYFKVKPCFNKVTGKKVPFSVIMKKMVIDVMGTEFDVKSYSAGDSIKTSLVKGSVKLKTDSREYQLEPGKAIVLNREGVFSRQRAVNLDEVYAWRALANFDNALIEEIMEHISRVFGINVIYVNKTSRRFTVDISATGSLADVLKDVEFAGGVKFRTVGKNVFVEFVNQ